MAVSKSVGSLGSKASGASAVVRSVDRTIRDMNPLIDWLVEKASGSSNAPRPSAPTPPAGTNKTATTRQPIEPATMPATALVHRPTASGTRRTAGTTLTTTASPIATPPCTRRVVVEPARIAEAPRARAARTTRFA
jgi:hypothetical protein